MSEPIRDTPAETPEGRGMTTTLAEALESLDRTIAFDSRDWSLNKRDAWIWGIVVGWDQSSGAMREVAARHGWDDETVARLRRLNAAVADAR